MSRCEFEHPKLDGPYVTNRGTVSLGAKQGSFTWSKAVKGISLLFLRGARANALDPKSSSSQISGATGSLAASLDYAILKKPAWLLDMFGTDSRGEPILREIVQRTNAGRKKPGPVIISVSLNRFSEGDIAVFLNEEPSNAVGELSYLVDFIEKSDAAALSGAVEAPLNIKEARAETQIRVLPENVVIERTTDIHTSLCASASVSGFGYDPFRDPKWKDEVARVFRMEALSTLSSREIFSRDGLVAAVERIKSNPILTKMAGKPPVVVDPIDLALEPSERIGGTACEEKLRQELNENGPIRIAMDTASIGAMMVLYHLKYHKGYPIDILYKFNDTTELAHRMIKGDFAVEPDGAVLSLPATCSLLKAGPETGYRPLMLLPQASHRVIAPEAAEEGFVFDRGEYIFMCERPGTSLLFFESLVQDGLIDRDNVTVKHRDPAEIAEAIQNGDESLRAVLFFPHYYLNHLYNKAVLAPQDGPGSRDIYHVLVLKDSILKHPTLARYLDIAIRDSWLNLLQDANVFAEVFSEIIDDPEYTTFVSRCSGLHQLNSQSSDSFGNEAISSSAQPMTLPRAV